MKKTYISPMTEMEALDTQLILMVGPGTTLPGPGKTTVAPSIGKYLYLEN